MKLLGVMVKDGVYRCDETTLANCIAPMAGDDANFATRLRKYMCSGFDKRSYDEECVEGWVRGVCGA